MNMPSLLDKTAVIVRRDLLTAVRYRTGFLLSAAGANIVQLNIVRQQLSRIKGGGLARACRAGRLISLIISDVPGDTLDLIASGPTVEGRSTPVELDFASVEKLG